MSAKPSRASTGVWAARVTLGLTAFLMLLPLVYQVGLSFKAPSDMFVDPLNPVDAGKLPSRVANPADAFIFAK